MRLTSTEKQHLYFVCAYLVCALRPLKPAKSLIHLSLLALLAMQDGISLKMPRYDTSHQIFDDAVGGTSVELRKLISYITSRCEPTSLVQKVASQCREVCLKRLRFLFGYGIPFKRFSSTNMDDLAAVSSLRIGAKDK